MAANGQYRLRYSWNLDFVGAGMGPSGSPQVGPGGGNAQTFGGINTPGGQNIVGTGTANAIAAADITTITNAMAADVAAQMNAQPALGRMQGFATGGT